MCRNYTEQITPAIDDRLSEESKENLFRHLAVCHQCNSEYQALLKIKNSLRNSATHSKAPEHLFQFLKTIPQQKEALSSISSNERFESSKIKMAENNGENKINTLHVVVGVTLSFLAAGYYLLSQ